MTVLTQAELEQLESALGQWDHQVMPFRNDKLRLCCKAARAYMDLMRQEPTNQSDLRDEYGPSNQTEDDGARIGRAKDAL